tara:strand:- start:407 stop:832 length:426 start_codon:yes stop_codon:yes gene_type:complete
MQTGNNKKDTQLSRTVVVYESGQITLDGQPTGFGVTQAASGTLVYALVGIDSPSRSDLGAQIQLPKRRYSLACPTRRLEFDRDFIATFEAARNYKALVSALKLAITAPTSALSQECVEMGEAFAGSLSPEKIERAKKEAVL